MEDRKSQKRMNKETEPDTSHDKEDVFVQEKYVDD